MQIGAVGNVSVVPGGGSPANQVQPPQNDLGAGTGVRDTTDAFGLEFESLLQIVLTQLTYQDPLKPMENFEFVSQLAQFSQIQQGQQMNDSLSALVSAQATSQAASLLGKTVDFSFGQNQLSGTVSAITFAGGSPNLTVETPTGQTISNIALANVFQIRETE